MPNCPSCTKEMQSSSSCGHCGGTLTSFALLKQVCPEGYFEKTLEHVKANGDLSKKNCSSCGHDMLAAFVEDTDPKLELDFCLECQSIWFDCNELKELPRMSEEKKKKLQEARLQVQAAVKSQKSSILDAVSDTAITLLLIT